MGSSRFVELRNLLDRKSTRLNSSHVRTSYAVFCLKKKSEADRRRVSARAGRDELPRRVFYLYSYGDRRDLHSFPTRRSSDLSNNPFPMASSCISLPL